MSSSVSVKTDGLDDAARDLFTDVALELLTELHERFDQRRLDLLAARGERKRALRSSGDFGFLPETQGIRDDDSWRVAPPRSDYEDRRVEITGPTDRKMMINALNSGARGFMADFEDSTSPRWDKLIEGQVNLIDAVDGTIRYVSSERKGYQLRKETATLLVRPRGLHLPERNLRFGDAAGSGALFDFGVFAARCAAKLADRQKGIYLYLPKLEHHLEARLWEEILTFTEEFLGLPRGAFRATVLIETFPAVFQIDEMLFELRDHSYGCNAGRWDYIFSAIKSLPDSPDCVLPNRADVTMTVPFMRAYTELVVSTCHRRGAFAMGGMAALIPSRRDPRANAKAFAAVKADKEREAGDGFDGTWVAHPDVVEVAASAFDAVLGDRPNQIDRLRDDVTVSEGSLVDLGATPGAVTEAGLRGNISVAFQYISFWLGGRGAVALNGLMEDAATAEIARTQIWQWIRHGVELDTGSRVTRDLVLELLDEELGKIRQDVGEEVWREGRPDETRAVFEAVALDEELPDFLTTLAYDVLEPGSFDPAAA
jgi:malate synthase